MTFPCGAFKIFCKWSSYPAVFLCSRHSSVNAATQNSAAVRGTAVHVGQMTSHFEEGASTVPLTQGGWAEVADLKLSCVNYFQPVCHKSVLCSSESGQSCLILISLTVLQEPLKCLSWKNTSPLNQDIPLKSHCLEKKKKMSESGSVLTNAILILKLILVHNRKRMHFCNEQMV